MQKQPLHVSRPVAFKKLWPGSSDQIKKIVMAAAVFLTKDALPYSVAENMGFS